VVLSDVARECNQGLAPEQVDWFDNHSCKSFASGCPEYASGLVFLTREAVEAGMIVGFVMATEAGRAAVGGSRAAPGGITVCPAIGKAMGHTPRTARSFPTRRRGMDEMRQCLGFASNATRSEFLQCRVTRDDASLNTAPARK
jgi:hypothetical protein